MGRGFATYSAQNCEFWRIRERLHRQHGCMVLWEDHMRYSLKMCYVYMTVSCSNHFPRSLQFLQVPTFPQIHRVAQLPRYLHSLVPLLIDPSFRQASVS